MKLASFYEPGDLRLDEFAGEIVDMGEGADRLAGRPTACAHQLAMGYAFPGGFAEDLIMPREVLPVDGLNRIPDGLGFAEASFAELLALDLTSDPTTRSQ